MPGPWQKEISWPPRRSQSASCPRMPTFGRYPLPTRLAAGGMAEIFLARLSGAGGFGKLIVIKRILPTLAQQATFVAMFVSEAKLGALLNHPNVCQVFELGEAEGHY